MTIRRLKRKALTHGWKVMLGFVGLGIALVFLGAALESGLALTAAFASFALAGLAALPYVILIAALVAGVCLIPVLSLFPGFLGFVQRRQFFSLLDDLDEAEDENSYLGFEKAIGLLEGAEIADPSEVDRRAEDQTRRYRSRLLRMATTPCLERVAGNSGDPLAEEARELLDDRPNSATPPAES